MESIADIKILAFSSGGVYCNGFLENILIKKNYLALINKRIWIVDLGSLVLCALGRSVNLDPDSDTLTLNLLGGGR